jgi:hypothetical protein
MAKKQRFNAKTEVPGLLPSSPAGSSAFGFNLRKSAVGSRIFRILPGPDVLPAALPILPAAHPGEQIFYKLLTSV